MINMQLTQAGTNNCRTFSINQMSKEVSNKTLTVINLKTTAKLDVVSKFFKNIQTNLETSDSNLISVLQTRIEQINQTKFSWFKSFLLFFAPYTKENLIEEKKAWEALVKDIQELSRQQFIELTMPDLSQFKLDSQIQFIQSDLNLISHNFSIYGQNKNFLDGKSIKIITIPTKACLVSTAKFFINIHEINGNQQKPLLSSLVERISFIKTATTGILRNFFLFFTPWTKWSLKAERKTWETVAKDLQEISEKCKALTPQPEKSSVQLNKEPEATPIPSLTTTLTLQKDKETLPHNPRPLVSTASTVNLTPQNNTPVTEPTPDSAGFGNIPPPPPMDVEESNIPPPPPMDFDGSNIPPPPDFEPPALTGTRFSLFNKPTAIQFFSNVSLLPNEPEPPKGFKARLTDAEFNKLEADTTAIQIAAIETYLAQLTKYNNVLNKALTTYINSEARLKSTIKVLAESIRNKEKELIQWKSSLNSASKNLETGSVKIEVTGALGKNNIEFLSRAAWEEKNAKLKKLKNSTLKYSNLTLIPETYIITPALLKYMENKCNILNTEIEGMRQQNRSAQNEMIALQVTRYSITSIPEEEAFAFISSKNEGITAKELQSGSEALADRIRMTENAIKIRRSSRKNSTPASEPVSIIEGISLEEIAKLQKYDNDMKELGKRIAMRGATASSDDDDFDGQDTPKKESILPSQVANLVDEVFGKGAIK